MPTMPRRLPVMRRPSIQVGDQPAQSSSGMMRAPSAMRRATARISAIVMSAVSSVRTPGVLVTVMPRDSAAWHVDMVDAVAEIGDQLEVRPGLGEEIGVDLVGHGRHQHVGALAPPRPARPGDSGLSSRLSRVSNNSRMRVSTTSGRRRVTTTSGLLLHRLPTLAVCADPADAAPSRPLNPRLRQLEVAARPPPRRPRRLL